MSNRRRSNRSGAAIWIALGVLVVLAIGVTVAASAVLRGPKDFDGAGSGTVSVTIPTGATAAKIGRILADGGVVASVDAFVDAAKNDARSRSIQPGTYELARGMKASLAVEALIDPSRIVKGRIVVPEGATSARVAALIAAETDIPLASVTAVMEDPRGLGLPTWANNEIEGFLFPASYDVAPTDDARAIVGAMVKRFNQFADSSNFEAQAASKGRDPYDVLIVASLVQAEVGPSDYAKAARVVDNRLEQGMRLQLDTTVNYARGRTDVRLSPEDLATDSPFNTYRNDGLPPTPINNPSEAAIDAALNPASGNWIYFVTTNLQTGETKFTDSYEEFLKFKNEFKANNP